MASDCMVFLFVFRPVSILSIISKVFEKVVYDQIESYLNDKKIVIEISIWFSYTLFNRHLSYIFNILSKVSNG